jgi:AcrR family transcriptional regulator
VRKKDGLRDEKDNNLTEQSESGPLVARNSEIDTKTRLLDAAGRLFSDRGFEAVPHRDIAVAAAVNLAAVNYHFGSKDRFIRATPSGA